MSMCDDKKTLFWARNGQTDTAVIKMGDDFGLSFNVQPMHAKGYMGQVHMVGTYRQAAVVTVTADGRNECKEKLIEDSKRLFLVINNGLSCVSY